MINSIFLLVLIHFFNNEDKKNPNLYYLKAIHSSSKWWLCEYANKADHTQNTAGDLDNEYLSKGYQRNIVYFHIENI